MTDENRNTRILGLVGGVVGVGIGSFNLWRLQRSLRARQAERKRVTREPDTVPDMEAVSTVLWPTGVLLATGLFVGTVIDGWVSLHHAIRQDAMRAGGR